MIVFWLVAVMLMVAALLFVLPPLFRSAATGQAARRAALNVSIYRDQLTEMARDLENEVLSQEQYQQGREEIEQRMLDDVGDSDVNAEPGFVAAGSKTTAIVLALAMPVVAVALYIELGAPEGLVPEKFQQAQMSEAQDQQGDKILEMVAGLAARLETDPNDAKGWKMLGRSYLMLRRMDEARMAYEEAVQRLPDDAQLLVDLADVIAMISNQSLEGRPMELLERALRLEPDNEQALWMTGTAAYHRQDYRVALGYWQRLMVMQPPGSDGAQIMAKNIAEIQSLLGEPVTVQVLPAASVAEESTAVSVGKISGKVSIASTLLDQVKPEDTVFIFAQTPNGSRMPLAVFRTTVAELPQNFTLDDSLAMMPAMSLSRYAEVILTARVSKSGNATPQSGDLQGRMGPVSSDGVTGIALVIDEVIK